MKRVLFVIVAGKVRFRMLPEESRFVPDEFMCKYRYGLMVEGRVYFCEGNNYGVVQEEYLTEDVLGQVTHIYESNFTTEPEFYNGIREGAQTNLPTPIKEFIY